MANMKKILLACLLILVLTACGEKYDREKSRALYDRLQTSDPSFTDDEYSLMIEQYLAMEKLDMKRLTEALQDPEKERELTSDTDYQEMILMRNEFEVHLEQVKDNLSSVNKERYAKVREEIQDMNEEYARKSEELGIDNRD